MLLEISGLPLHPLVVHAVVVLLPLTTLGAVAVAARPRWAGAYGPLITVLAVVGAVAAFVAQQAGEALQVHLLSQGDTLDGFGDHSALGHMVLYLATTFALAAVVSTVLARRAGAGSRPHRLAAWLAAGLGVAATAYAYLAGESGASSVWGYLFA